LDEINHKISALKKDETFISLKKSVKKRIEQIEEELAFQRKKMKIAKKERKIRKKSSASILTESDFSMLIKKLEQESFNEQFFYKELKAYYENDLQKKQAELDFFENKIASLKKERIQKSNYLQKTLFERYAFLNAKKEWKSLLDIFSDPMIKPPAGSGECAAPKLLQYAFLNDLEPICMAEFWWGISPNSEIRKHTNFYPACQSRCKPILSHMLQDIKMDENLLIESLTEHQEIPIIYEDDELIIVNKPAEFLSVPGKEISDSVYTRMKEKYPDATGPLIVHRLDMSTS
jgi:tRNA pseudouridine32 synthase/23S rRNA pseudouridine746 synthase